MTPEDNELLTRVGAGTKMGALLRSYWVPILLSDELPEPDGQPMRVRIFGESLVAFRVTDGRIGLLGEHCPHRRASFYLGRVEDCSLRCVYHGWQFDLEGNCLDQPSEPGERAAMSRVKAKAYPAMERNGIIWAYLGRGAAPPLPDIEWGLVQDSHRYVSRRVLDCNWAQVIEADMDTSHASFLHRRLKATDFDRLERRKIMNYMYRDGHPVFEIAEADHGLIIAARRNAEQDSYYWRITQFLFPFFVMPASYEDYPFRSNVFCPMDDNKTLVWTIDWHPSRPLTAEELKIRNEGKIGHCVDFLPASSEAGGKWRPRSNNESDYFMNYARSRTEQFSSIQEVWAQDKAVCESMGVVTDRAQEFLGKSDAAIVRWRRLMLQSARNFSGKQPPGQDPRVQRVRSANFVLPRDRSWKEVIGEFSRAGLDVPIHPKTV